MEEFTFTPKEEPTARQNVAEFSFTPKKEPDFSKLKADEIFSTDGMNTNAPQKMNAVMNSWLNKDSKIYKTAFLIDQTAKSGARSIAEMGKSFGTLFKFAGDNLNALGERDALYDGKQLKFMKSAGNSLNNFADWIQKNADIALSDKSMQLDEQTFSGDFLDNPSFTRATAAVGSALPSLVGMGAMAKVVGAGPAYFVMAGVDSADAYEKAKEKGKTQAESNKYYGLSVAGTAMIDKVLSPLESIMKAAPNGVLKKLSKRFVDGLLEGTAETGQQLWQNAIINYGIDPTQKLAEGVIEAAIGGFGSGAIASGMYSDAREELKAKGATDEEVDAMTDAIGRQALADRDGLNDVAMQVLQEGMSQLDKFVQENFGTPEAQKALRFKEELQAVKNEAFERLTKAGMPEEQAMAASQVEQGIALWGAQEFGLSPLEYMRSNSPQVRAEKFEEFQKQFEQTRATTQRNPFEILINKAEWNKLEKAANADRGASLIQFLRSKGGVVDAGGDLKSRDAGKQAIGLINNKSGMTLDDAALAAWEQGYLPNSTYNYGRPDINALLDAIDDELRGNKRYSSQMDKMSDNVRLLDAVKQLDEEMYRLGVDYSNMSAAEAEQAYRKAAEEYMRQAQPKSEDEEYEKAMADYYANGDNTTAQNTKADEWDDIPFQESLNLAKENELLDAVNPAYEGETIDINGVEKTVYNSNGDRIAKSAEALRNFYKWFGDSKVVDEQGRPLVVYHGTRAMKWGKPLPEFSVFSRAGSRAYQNRVGFFFGETESFARAFGDRIMPVYLNLQNPKIFKKGTPTNEELSLEQKEVDTAKSDDTKYIAQKILNNSKKYTDAYDKFIMDMYHKSGLIPYQNSMYGDFNDAMQLGRDEAYDIADTYREELQKDGYDGVIIIDTKVDANSNNGKPNTQYVAFESNQIKSIDNRGTYNPNNDNIYYQGGEIFSNNPANVTNRDNPSRITQRDIESFLPEEQEAFDSFLSKRPDKERILKNLKEHKYDSKGKITGYYKNVIEGIFIQEAIDDYFEGKPINFESALDARTSSGKKSSLMKVFESSEFNSAKTDDEKIEVIYRRYLFGSILAHPTKVVNSVNSSLINCNPSPACAQFCYATKGNYTYIANMPKKEVLDVIARKNPKKLAQWIAQAYKTTVEYSADKALRLFDMGDGNEHWVEVAKELNKQGIRVAIFTKKPDFMRAIKGLKDKSGQEANLTMLSIDSTNEQLAKDNKDLDIAYVYQGEENLKFVKELQEEGRLSVVLPVKLGRDFMSEAEVKKLTDAGIEKNHICPIDAGWGKLHKANDKTPINMKDGNELKPVKIGEWNCALCDRYGGMGCYFKKTTRQLKEMLENYRANGLTNATDDVNILIDGLGEILQSNKLTEGLSDEIIKQLGITDEQIAKRASVLQGKMGTANARVFAGFSIILERARHRQSELERSAKDRATEEGILGSEARPSIRDNGKTQSVLRGRSESGEGKQTDVRGVSRDISADSGSGVLNENDVNYQSAYVSMRNELEGDYLDADRFEGTGEGNAAHGWGNYALKDRETNKIRYYDWMSQDKIYYDGEEVDGKEDSAIKRAVDEYIVNGKDAEKTKKSIRGIIKSSEYDIKVTEKQISDLGEAYHISKEEIRLLRELKDLEDSFYELSLIDRKGTIEKAQEIRAKLSPKAIYESDRFNMAFDNLDTAERVKNLYKEALDVDFSKIEVKRTGAQYEIDVPEDEFLLDEDLTFRNQSEYVQKRVKKLVEEENLNKIFEIYQSEERPNYNTLENEDGRSIYQAIAHALGSQKAASKMLEKYGIKGIKYEGSADGIGYVIFKGADAPIIQRLLQSTGKGVAKGAYTGSDNVIHLFETADASTFMHETAHWFRRELRRSGTKRSIAMLKKVDAWENAEFDKRYKVELKDGYYVIKDTRGNMVYNKQFNTENEAREYGRNEIFARGFEQFLRTGKAPSNYLKSAFKSFWNWLRTLYRSAKQLNADINDDIETVYGTILGGTDLDFYLNEEPGVALQKKFVDNEERNKYIEENISKAQAMATEPKMFENFVAEKTESKKGKAEFLTNLIVPISTRAKRVSQSLKNRLRAYDYVLPQKINEYNARIKPFMDKWAKFTQDDMVAFDMALKNDYVTKQLEILEKYDALDDFEEVHDLLNYLYEEAQSVGVEMGYRENYFPREVADVDGLMSYLYGPRAISELRRAEREAHYEDMTPDEQAEFVNKFLRGYERKDLTKSLPGNVKERRIDVVTSDMNVFYKNSMQALMTYIERMTNSIESRRFWGMDAAHIEDSIGAFVDDMIEKGEIKPEQDKEVENILRARFKARGVSNKFLLYQKNMAYIYTMGGINSAITQIDDISVALYKAGLWNTVQSIFAPKHKGLSREELGLTRIGEEFMEASASSKAVSAVFKATGLDKIDAFGKNVLINATFKKFQKMAKSNEAKLREYLEPIMEQETDATIEAIKNDEVTDNVKLLMFNELADMQPISLSEMPEYYLTSGNGRVLYMLKTFALKRIDIFRNECFDKMRKGEVKSGLQNLFKLSMLMMLCGMGKDAIIDLLFGRKIVMEDSIVNNLLGLFGFSKYQLYRARSDGFTGLLTSVAVPPILPMWSDLFKDLYNSLFTKNGKDIEDWEVWKGIPIIGRFYYWWMGGGYAKEQKKKKKLK